MGVPEGSQASPKPSAAAGPIGLFGGSFDPVHKAHLHLAASALQSLALQCVRWMPNSVPGHREQPLASAAHRLAMLRIALEGDTRCCIDQSELWQSGPTYSVNTLARLRQELGTEVSLVFIIGADHLLGLHRWCDWRQLLALTHFAVAERPGHEIQVAGMDAAVAAEYRQRKAPVAALAAQPAGCIVGFPTTPMDISSTAIRAARAAGENLGDMVPAAVLDYIESNRLYLDLRAAASTPAERK